MKTFKFSQEKYFLTFNLHKQEKTFSIELRSTKQLLIAKEIVHQQKINLLFQKENSISTKEKYYHRKTLAF